MRANEIQCLKNVRPTKLSTGKASVEKCVTNLKIILKEIVSNNLITPIFTMDSNSDHWTEYVSIKKTIKRREKNEIEKNKRIPEKSVNYEEYFGKLDYFLDLDAFWGICLV